MRRVALFLAVLFLVGCGSGRARSDLQKTSTNLRAIGSGKLLMKLVVDPATDPAKKSGFILSGPYELVPNTLPIGRVAYTTIHGKKLDTLTFISDGEHAFLRTGGKTARVPAKSRREVRSVARGLTGGNGIGSFGIDQWIDHPKETDGGIVGGVETAHITGKLDAAAAANALIAFVAQFSRDRGTIAGADADQLRNAVASSSIDVWTGKRDKLLRRMVLKAQLGSGLPSQLKDLLGHALTASVDFELAITDPNKPVHITPPKNVSR